MYDKQNAPADKGNNAVAKLVQNAVDAFSKDAKKEFKTLLEAYEDQSAVVGVFGMGSVKIGVKNGKVVVDNDDKLRKTKFVGRGATYPETIVALSEGGMTPLEAFHTGDIVVRAESEQLHRAYGFAVKMTEAAVRSKALQDVLKQFRATANV